MPIFKDFAPQYWAVGLPVIPLKRWNSPGKGAGKAPILSEWTAYAQHMPSEAVRNLWLTSYPDSNIGLPFGEASGLCAIDIDTEDQNLIDVILSVLPKSPWKRVGQKGMGLIYRWQGQPNFKLRDGDNQSIVEFLGKGNQMVLPPSIHPKTERPYTANADLWDVLDQVPPLPLDLEAQLRQALGKVAGLSIAQTSRSAPLDVVPQGERDIQMVRHAGYLARVVRGIDKNERFSLAEAIEHMAHWVENFTSHTAGGDDMDPNKGVAKLVEFLLKDVEAGNTLPNGWDEGLTEEQRAHSGIAAMIEKNTTQRWTHSKARDWLEAKVAIDPQNGDRILDLVTEITEAVAKDENFAESHFMQLIEDINRVSKGVLKFSRTDLRAAFRAARKGDQEQAADHEAIARQVLEDMGRGGEIRHDQGRFWQWNGSCFEGLDDHDIQRKIAESVKGNMLAKRHGDYVSVAKTGALISRAPLASELEDGINFASSCTTTRRSMARPSPCPSTTCRSARAKPTSGSNTLSSAGATTRTMPRRLWPFRKPLPPPCSAWPRNISAPFCCTGVLVRARRRRWKFFRP